MKKYVVCVLLAIMLITIVLCGCRTRYSVVEEVYEGNTYMTMDEANAYVLNFLVDNEYKYNNTSTETTVRYFQQSEYKNEISLEQKIVFSDGTSITLPCKYADVTASGWKAEDNSISGLGYYGMMYCKKPNDWRLGLHIVRPNEDNPITNINDLNVEGITLFLGDFATKENYCRVLSCHPEFTYMGIDRSCTPKQVIEKLGLPYLVEHNGVNMEFEYTMYIASSDTRINVTMTWLTLADGPEIMRDFEIECISPSEFRLW